MWFPQVSTYWLERLFSKMRIDKRTGCWVWTGFASPSGYGIYKRTENGGTIRDVATHRVSYNWFIRPLSDSDKGMHVEHMCRNRLCFNPRHLELVTPKENNRRARLSRRSHRALIASLSRRESVQ